MDEGIRRLVFRPRPPLGRQLPPPGTAGDRRDDAYGGWDSTGAYLLAYAMPLKKIWLTGKRPAKVPQLDAATAQQLILDGRGWSHKDRYSAYDELSGDQLFECLGSWSPIVRERAAMALARRKDAPVGRWSRLLESPRLEARLGACQALAQLRGKAAPAVPALRETLHADDLWLRIKAADALAAIGEPGHARPARPARKACRGPDRGGPARHAAALPLLRPVQQRGGLLGKSLEGVDRELLFKAVCAGLQNEDGRARGSFVTVYDNLTFEEIKPLLPAIHRGGRRARAERHHVCRRRSRPAGLELLAKHRIEEGIELLADYVRNQKQHASEKRVPMLEMLKSYGAHAQA